MANESKFTYVYYRLEAFKRVYLDGFGSIAVGWASPRISADWTRQTSAAFIRAQAASSELLASIARQASSITKVSKPALRASSAEWATQKSVANPQANTRLIPRAFKSAA